MSPQAIQMIVQALAQLGIQPRSEQEFVQIILQLIQKAAGGMRPQGPPQGMPPQGGGGMMQQPPM